MRGLGLVQLPDYYVQPALQQGQLKEVLHSFAIRKEPISAITPANLYQANATKALMDYLAEHLSDRLGASYDLGLGR